MLPIVLLMHTRESRQIIRHSLAVMTMRVLDGEHDEEDNEKDNEEDNKGNGKGSRREERYYTKGNGHEVRKASQWVR